MTIFLQAVINGVSLGAIYATIALSYTIIYRTLKTAHFAQGDIYMIGMVLTYLMNVVFNLPFILSMIVGALLTAFLLLVIERFVYRSIFEKASSLNLFICTIGMATFLRNATQMAFGSETRALPAVLGKTPIRLPNGVSIMPQNLIIIGSCAVICLVLFLFLKYSKTGLAMSAVSMNRNCSKLMGINFNKTVMITYAISAAIAAIAGALTGPVYNVYTSVGATLGFKAFVAAIMGGFGSCIGAVSGGLLLGLVEALGSLYISSTYKDAFAYILLVIILIIKPQGLFGKKLITKV